jgi:hypothetical protein
MGAYLEALMHASHTMRPIFVQSIKLPIAIKYKLGASSSALIQTIRESIGLGAIISSDTIHQPGSIDF